MKKTLHLILGVLLLPLALGAQSLPKAEEAFEKGDYTTALAQYKQLMQSATGDDRLHAQLRYAACQFGLGEYLNAAKTIWDYKKIVDILVMLCYNRNEKKSCKGNVFTQKESPQSCSSEGFLARYGELIRLGCCCLLFTVQPFAYVVANYTC